MRLSIVGLLLAVSVVVSGCVTPPQTPVSLRAEALPAPGARVGVALSTLPKPDTFFPGADCLLCIAAASMTNNGLTTQVRTLGTEELQALPKDLATLLSARGQTAVVLDPIDLSKLGERKAEPGKARHDFSPLRTAHNLDRLLVVQIDSLGFTRNFAAYVPTGDPRATVNGAAYLVDLNTLTLDWYQPLTLSVPSADKWDEPPKYPGLTNAYFQAVERAMDQVRTPFVAK